MSKGPEAFRTISEVAEELDIPQHVLRFWETRFPQIKPIKRGGGRRFYRPDDVALLAGIRHLLYGAGYTIRGVQKILKEHGVAHVQALVSSLPYDPNASVAAVAQALELPEKPVQRSLFHDQEMVRQLRPTPDLPIIDAIDASLADDIKKPADCHVGTDVTPSAAGSFKEALSSLPLEPLVDARAATVSAAYTALSSASVPLHPRAGFVRAEDFQADDPFLQQADALQDKPGAMLDHAPGRHVPSHHVPDPLTVGIKAPSARQTPADNADINHVIQPHYHLTTVTRDRLQAVLEELRECRRLLGSTTSRQLD